MEGGEVQTKRVCVMGMCERSCMGGGGGADKESVCDGYV